jgi:hypothetical protein
MFQSMSLLRDKRDLLRHQREEATKKQQQSIKMAETPKMLAAVVLAPKKAAE